MAISLMHTISRLKWATYSLAAQTYRADRMIILFVIVVNNKDHI